MSKVQRERLDVQLRGTGIGYEQSIGELVQVGTNEMLLDDARRLALRASDAEVDLFLDITAKVPHVFQSFTGVLDEADEALDRAVLFLRQRVRG